MLSNNQFTEENAVFFKALSSELRETHKLKGQFRGDFVEKSINLNLNIDRSSMSKSADEILRDISSDRGGEE